jgi:LPS-assembly protein
MAGTGTFYRDQRLIILLRTHFLLLFFLICCLASPATAIEMPVFDENIHINADHMSQSSRDGEYTAEGNVVVLWKGLNLVADQVRYNVATHIINASGSVVMSKGATVLKGDKLVLNMDTSLAEMDATLLTVPETGMSVTSEKLIRINENEFSATTTELTMCDMPDPSWKFGADKLKVNLLGYATGRNVIFYVKDVPVLYLPWIAFPVVMEKRSGLLFPRFGYSKASGAQLDIPAYWVISPSQDLQLDLDIMSRRGVGTGIDYRYIRTRGSEGHISVYQIYDQVENRWRWQLAQEHKEIFSTDANLRMAVNATSDRTFSNVFGEKSGDYNRQSSDTTINTLKTWQNYAITSYLRYNEDLYAPDNRSTVQTLPSLGVTAVRHAIYSLPLYFDLDASADNLYREAGPTGQRLHLFPRITLLPFQSSYLQASFFAGAHIRGYVTNKRGSPLTQTSDGDLLPETGVKISTSLSRIYDTDLQLLKKIRHELIPEIRYSFMPERDQQRLPSYDYTDRMIYQNMVSMSVTNVINGKFVSDGMTEYRDISRIKLSADYAIRGVRRDLLTLVESQRSWSDLLLESETLLTKRLMVTFDTRYNIYEKHLSTAEVGIKYDDQQGNAVGIGYQMAQNEVEYFEGKLSTRLIKPLNLSYTTRYSFDRSDFLESVYAAEYRHKCWSVNIAVHQRPGNQSYTVNFNLAGLGNR